MLKIVKDRLNHCNELRARAAAIKMEYLDFFQTDFGRYGKRLKAEHDEIREEFNKIRFFFISPISEIREVI